MSAGHQDGLTNGAPIGAIAVVDDHRLFLEGISILLSRILPEVRIAAFDSPIELIQALEDGDAFDLAICDLVMQRMNGLAFVDAIKGRHALPVLILSGTNSPPPLEEMQKLGVMGFVHKSVEESTLKKALETVSAGRAFYGEEEADLDGQGNADFGRQVELAGQSADLPNLSPRQIEVLKLVADGATNSEVARVLEISENTVKSHLKLVFDAFRVTKRTACVRAARSFGIV